MFFLNFLNNWLLVLKVFLLKIAQVTLYVTRVLSLTMVTISLKFFMWKVFNYSTSGWFLFTRKVNNFSAIHR